MNNANDILGDVESTEVERETPEVEKAEMVVAPTVDYSAIGKSVADGLKPTLDALKPTPEARKFTEEELDAKLHRFKPDAEFLAKFGNMETQGAAMVQMRDAFVKQAATIAQIIVAQETQRLEKAFEEKYGKVTENVSNTMLREQTEKAHKEFDDAYPQLASPKLRGLRTQIAGEIANSANSPKDKAEFFKLVANGLADVLRESNPTFTLTASVANGKPNNNKSATNSHGFGGGGAKGGGNAAAPSTAGDILGPVGRR